MRSTKLWAKKYQFKWLKHDISHLPSVPTLVAVDKGHHGLICTPGLSLWNTGTRTWDLTMVTMQVCDTSDYHRSWLLWWFSRVGRLLLERPFSVSSSPPPLPPFLSTLPTQRCTYRKLHHQVLTPTPTPPQSTPTHLCISAVSLFTLGTLQQVCLRPSSWGGNLSVTNSNLCKLLPKFLHCVTSYFLGEKWGHSARCNSMNST